jgi:hypothetical protein
VNGAANPTVALRRFRTPIPARVDAEDGRPVRLRIDHRGFSDGRIAVAAGPWRTSGAWWENNLVHRSPESESGLVSPKPRSGEGGWDRDEWDVALADGVTYRLFHERVPAEARRAGWFVEGVVD